MKKPVQKITRDTQLRVPCIRVAHGGKLTSFQSMEGALGSFVEGITPKEPSLGFYGEHFVIPALPQVKSTVRQEVRDDDLGGQIAR